MDGVNNKPRPKGSPAQQLVARELTTTQRSVEQTVANVLQTRWAAVGQCTPPQLIQADPIASKQYDGFFISVGGRLANPSDTRFDELEAVQPKSGASGGTTLFVNGMMNTLGDQMAAMQELADVTGTGVVGLHNATDGGFFDVMEAIGQKLGLRTPAVVSNCASFIQSQLDKNLPVRLAGHSQGGLVIAQAIETVIDRWKAARVPAAEIKRRLASMEVTTFGSAATSYPDGPKYTHLLNEEDPIVKAAAVNYRSGVGARLLRFKDAAKATGDAIFGPHLLKTYLAVYQRLAAQRGSSQA